MDYESKERVFFENWMTEHDYDYDNIPIEELMQAYADEQKIRDTKKLISAFAFLRSVILSGESYTNEVKNVIDDALETLKQLEQLKDK